MADMAKAAIKLSSVRIPTTAALRTRITPSGTSATQTSSTLATQYTGSHQGTLINVCILHPICSKTWDKRPRRKTRKNSRTQRHPFRVFRNYNTYYHDNFLKNIHYSIIPHGKLISPHITILYIFISLVATSSYSFVLLIVIIANCLYL